MTDRDGVALRVVCSYWKRIMAKSWRWTWKHPWIAWGAPAAPPLLTLGFLLIYERVTASETAKAEIGPVLLSLGASVVVWLGVFAVGLARTAAAVDSDLRRECDGLRERSSAALSAPALSPVELLICQGRSLLEENPGVSTPQGNGPYWLKAKAWMNATSKQLALQDRDYQREIEAVLGDRMKADPQHPQTVGECIVAILEILERSKHPRAHPPRIADRLLITADFRRLRDECASEAKMEPAYPEDRDRNIRELRERMSNWADDVIGKHLGPEARADFLNLRDRIAEREWAESGAAFRVVVDWLDAANRRL